MNAVSEELLSSFRFRFRNWDSMSIHHPPFLTDPFRLSLEDHDFLVDSVERMHALVTKARQRIAHVPDWMCRLGLDSWTQEAILQELKSSRLERGIEIARYDFFKTADGRWMISEINNDVPSGFNESSFMHEISHKAYAATETSRIPEPITDNFIRSLKEKNLKSLAMLYGTAYSEDLQICLFLKDNLSPSLKVTLGSPAHLKVSHCKATVLGQDIDAIYRIYPVEWFSSLPNRDEWMRALSLDNLMIVNPLSTIISQSKNFFSVLTAHADTLFGSEDAGWISRFIPKTELFITEKRAVYAGEKNRWVLKPIFGRMGYDVAIGKLLPQDSWEKCLAEAVKNPGQYVIQECFDIAPVRFSLADCYPCVGVFVINGRFSGYFTRASLTPLTTYEAMDVATIIKIS